MLTFSKGNSKLHKDIWNFSLPAGHTCPGANECLTFAHAITGKLIDGRAQRFRCFSASQENTYPEVRHSRQRNLKALSDDKGHHSVKKMAQRLEADLPENAEWLRIHVSGDFFNQKYFDAWMVVAARHPDTVFYAYTKSLLFWSNRLTSIPVNMRLTASRGGKFDFLIERLGLRYAEVCFSRQDAHSKGLFIDHDDSHAAASGNHSFALLLHGVQPAGSEASQALSALKRSGDGGYSSEKKVNEALAFSEIVRRTERKLKRAFTKTSQLVAV